MNLAKPSKVNKVDNLSSEEKLRQGQDKQFHQTYSDYSPKQYGSRVRQSDLITECPQARGKVLDFS